MTTLLRTVLVLSLWAGPALSGLLYARNPIPSTPEEMAQRIDQLITARWAESDDVEPVEQPPGEVCVSTGFSPSMGWFVDVVDNGPGVAPEDREKIFSLFESRKGMRGTGLGLPVSAKIMREHGYDKFEDHKTDHEALLDELRDIMDEYELEASFDDEALAKALGEWFGQHFRTRDARLHSKLG